MSVFPALSSSIAIPVSETPQSVGVAFYASSKARKPSQETLPFQELYARLQRDRASFSEKDGPAISLGVLSEGATRAKSSVISVSWLGLDLDGVSGAALKTLLKLLKDQQIQHITYSTYSHKSPSKGGLGCARVLIPLSTPITEDIDQNLRAAYLGLQEILKDLVQLDRQTFDSARLFFTPRKESFEGQGSWCQFFGGSKALDPAPLISLGEEVEASSKIITFQSPPKAARQAYLPEAHQELYDDPEFVSLEVEAALGSISSTCEYNQWLAVLTSIQTLLGDGGFELARSWSSASPQYCGDQEFTNKWMKLPKGGDFEIARATIRKAWGSGAFRAWRSSLPRTQNPKTKPRVSSTLPPNPPTCVGGGSPSPRIYPALTGLAPRLSDAPPWLAYFQTLGGGVSPRPAPKKGDSARVWRFVPASNTWSEITPQDIQKGMGEAYEALLEVGKTEKGVPILYNPSASPHQYLTLLGTPLLAENAPEWEGSKTGVVMARDAAFVWDSKGLSIVKDNLHELNQTSSYPWAISEALASSPLWDKYVSEMLQVSCHEESKARVEFLQAWVGSALLGVTPTIQAPALFLQGVRGAGKSTLISVIRQTIGDSLNATLTPQDLGERFRLIEIEGARLISHTEVPPLKIQNASILKSVIFGEKVYAEAKGVQGREVTPQAAAIWAGNELPDVRGFDAATQDRLAVLHVFPKTYRNTKEEIKNLAQNLLGEQREIVIKCLRSFEKMMLDHGKLVLPKSIEQATNEWKLNSDKASAWIIKNIRSGAPIKKALKLRAAYQTFCESLRADGVKDQYIPALDSFLDSLKNLDLFEEDRKAGNSPILVFKSKHLTSGELAGAQLLGDVEGDDPWISPSQEREEDSEIAALRAEIAALRAAQALSSTPKIETPKIETSPKEEFEVVRVSGSFDQDQKESEISQEDLQTLNKDLAPKIAELALLSYHFAQDYFEGVQDWDHHIEVSLPAFQKQFDSECRNLLHSYTELLNFVGKSDVHLQTFRSLFDVILTQVREQKAIQKEGDRVWWTRRK